MLRAIRILGKFGLLLQQINHPDRQTAQDQQDESPEFVAFYIIEKNLKGVAEEITGSPKKHRPGECSKKVERDKQPKWDLTDPPREGGDRAQAVEEAEAENNRDTIVADQSLYAFQSWTPVGLPCEQVAAVSPPQVEEELVAEQGAEESLYAGAELAGPCRNCGSESQPLQTCSSLSAGFPTAWLSSADSAKNYT